MDFGRGHPTARSLFGGSESRREAAEGQDSPGVLEVGYSLLRMIIVGPPLDLFQVVALVIRRATGYLGGEKLATR